MKDDETGFGVSFQKRVLWLVSTVVIPIAVIATFFSFYATRELKTASARWEDAREQLYEMRYRYEMIKEELIMLKKDIGQLRTSTTALETTVHQQSELIDFLEMILKKEESVGQ